LIYKRRNLYIQWLNVFDGEGVPISCLSDLMLFVESVCRMSISC